MMYGVNGGRRGVMCTVLCNDEGIQCCGRCIEGRIKYQSLSDPYPAFSVVSSVCVYVCVSSYQWCVISEVRCF